MWSMNLVHIRYRATNRDMLRHKNIFEGFAAGKNRLNLTIRQMLQHLANETEFSPRRVATRNVHAMKSDVWGTVYRPIVIDQFGHNIDTGVEQSWAHNLPADPKVTTS